MRVKIKYNKTVSRMESLESLIQKTAFEIVIKKILDKNNIEKLLGILVNDGVYAMWVFAKSKKGIDENNLMNTLKPILDKVMPKEDSESWEVYLQKVSKNIHRLLFLKQILERILIYARYHAKALGD